MHARGIRWFVVAPVFLAVGCSTDSDPGDSVPKVFETFSVATRSVYREKTNTGWQWRVSVTDATGSNACAGAASPATARTAGTHEILLTFVNDAEWPGSCGSHLGFQVNGCPTDVDDWSHPPIGCAYYRHWDAAAGLVDVQPAAFGSLLSEGTCGGDAGADLAQSFDLDYHIALRFDLDAGEEHFDDSIHDSSSAGSGFCP